MDKCNIISSQDVELCMTVVTDSMDTLCSQSAAMRQHLKEKEHFYSLHTYCFLLSTLLEIQLCSDEAETY